MALRFASYNIRKAVGLDRRRDPARILAVLNGINADVVALQEADRRLGPRPSVIPPFLIAQETDYKVIPVAENNVSLGWHGNALLVRRDMTVIESGRIELPGLEPRGAVMATISIGEITIDVVGTHLGLLRRWRYRQFMALRNHIDERNPANTVLLGDFNEWSETGGMEPLDDFLTVRKPGRSFHASRPLAPLDRIAHGSALECRDCGVDRSLTARVASDHLPVWAEIGLR